MAQHDFFVYLRTKCQMLDMNFKELNSMKTGSLTSSRQGLKLPYDQSQFIADKSRAYKLEKENRKTIRNIGKEQVTFNEDTKKLFEPLTKQTNEESQKQQESSKQLEEILKTEAN